MPKGRIQTPSVKKVEEVKNGGISWGFLNFLLFPGTFIPALYDYTSSVVTHVIVQVSLKTISHKVFL